MEQRPQQIDHELLLAQSGWVRGLARNLVQDPYGAEDVAQETMLAALSSPPSKAHDVRSLRAWLARVATNLARLTSRRTVRRQRREAVVARPEAVSSAGEIVERAGQLRLVVDAVLRLDEPYRSTVLLRYVDGLTTAQIAQRTDANAVTVRKRLSRGVERLRDRLDDDHEGDRRAWVLAMLPFASNAMPPLPISSLPWWNAWRTAAITLGVLTIAGLSALVATALRGGTKAEAAVPPVAFQAEEPAPEREPVLDDELVLWDLPFGESYEEVEHRPTRRVEPGQRADDPPQPEPVPAAARKLRGRAVDLAGRGVPGLELRARVGDRELALGETGVGGSFVVEAEEEWGAFVLTGAGNGYAALRESPVEAKPRGSAGRAHVLVVDRAVALSGWVLDPHGAPVEGAELSIEVPDSVYLDLPVSIERSHLAARATRSDELGGFELANVVAHHGLLLRTRAEGFADDVRPALGGGGLERIQLRSPSQVTARLDGVVVLPGGRPAVGASVRVGHARTRADDRGRFSLPYVPGRGREIVAYAEGWLPVVQALGTVFEDPSPPSVVDAPGERGEGGSKGSASNGRVSGAVGGPGSGRGTPSFAQLQLGGPPLTIGGTLTEDGGEALAGWVVLASDEESDPRYPELAPGAPVRRATTDAEGRFLVDGLLRRDYTLRAYDPGTLNSVEPTQIRAGRGDVRLRATRGNSAIELAQVVARDGSPLGFAQVTAALPTGGGTRVLGDTVVAGAGGRFERPGVGRPIQLLVEHTKAMNAVYVGNGPVTVYRDAWFSYAGGTWSVTPDALGVEDVSGVALVLHGPSGSAATMPLFAGRSNVLRVTENGTQLVFFQRGNEVGREPLNLIAGEVIVVGGPTTGGNAGGTPAGATQAAGGVRSRAAGGATAMQGGLGGPVGGENEEEGPETSENPGNTVTTWGSWQP